MYIYKVLKNNEVIYIGTTEEMEFSRKNYVLKEKWWIEKDKILYTEISGAYSANLYKKLLRTLYGLDKDDKASSRFIAHKGFITDNLEYKVFFDSKKVINNEKKDEMILLEERKNRREKILKKKKKIMKSIQEASSYLETDDSFRMVPLHAGNYPKSDKRNSIHALMNTFIVVPKDYSLKGLREITRLYLKISEERSNTLICQKDIDNLIEKYGEFSLFKMSLSTRYTWPPIFTSPAFFIRSLNHEEYEEKLGFKRYYTQAHYDYEVVKMRIYSSKLFQNSSLAGKAAELEYEMEERDREKRELYMEFGIGLSHDSQGDWENIILGLDSEIKEVVRQNLECIKLNIKGNKKRAESSIEILYNLGFVKQIPDWVEKRRDIKGIIYVGNYYCEQTFIDAFNGLKNVKANEWY